MGLKTSRRSVLIVEDDFVLRTSLASLLAGQGYDVECAANGLEAFQRLNDGLRKPAVIILDLVMPYMDGVEFRSLQKALPSISDVPVVVITANAASAADAARLEVDSTLFKPINTSRLLDTVRELPATAV